MMNVTNERSQAAKERIQMRVSKEFSPEMLRADRKKLAHFRLFYVISKKSDNVIWIAAQKSEPKHTQVKGETDTKWNQVHSYHFGRC